MKSSEIIEGLDKAILQLEPSKIDEVDISKVLDQTYPLRHELALNYDKMPYEAARVCKEKFEIIYDLVREVLNMRTEREIKGKDG